MAGTESASTNSAAVKLHFESLNEFRKLVLAIIFYKLRREKRTGVEEDMKNAFLKAVEEVHADSKRSSYDAAKLSQRIRDLQKKYKILRNERP